MAETETDCELMNCETDWETVVTLRRSDPQSQTLSCHTETVKQSDFTVSHGDSETGGIRQTKDAHNLCGQQKLSVSVQSLPKDTEVVDRHRSCRQTQKLRVSVAKKYSLTVSEV